MSNTLQIDLKAPGTGPITGGAELILAMRLHGTGEAKLNVARLALVQHGNAATAEDVLTELRKRPDIVPHATVLKAESLSLTGQPPPAPKAAPQMEDMLAPEAFRRQMEEAERKGRGAKAAGPMTPDEIASLVSQSVAATIAKMKADDEAEFRNRSKADAEAAKARAEAEAKVKADADAAKAKADAAEKARADAEKAAETAKNDASTKAKK